MTYPTLCFQLQRCNAQRIMGRYENFVKIIREIFGVRQYFSYLYTVKRKKKEDLGLRGVRARSYGHKSKGFARRMKNEKEKSEK